MRNLKKALSLILVAVFCLSLCTVAFAAETDAAPSAQEVSTESNDAVQPRIGMGGYQNHNHTSGYYGEFKVSTKSLVLPFKKFTVETAGFDSDTMITIGIYNSKGQQVSDGLVITGNTKVEDVKMISAYFVNGDTYTVKYNVSKGSDDGWIGVWIF